MKVFVYWNLHKQCWSVMDQKTRRVVHHLQELSLFNCVFKVSEAGRQRVIRERRKNVHAGIVGTLCSCHPAALSGERQVKYNPYKQEKFTVDDCDVTSARFAMFHPDKSVTVLGETYA